MDIEFITSVSVIAADPPAARQLYVETLGLPLENPSGGEYYWSDQIGGSKHFGVWSLPEAAQACFGVSEWPSDRPVPQVSLEFEVADAAAVQAAAEELEAAGFGVLHPARKEPWGQIVARLLSGEGSIVGISYAPQLH